MRIMHSSRSHRGPAGRQGQGGQARFVCSGGQKLVLRSVQLWSRVRWEMLFRDHTQGQQSAHRAGRSSARRRLPPRAHSRKRPIQRNAIHSTVPSCGLHRQGGARVAKETGHGLRARLQSERCPPTQPLTHPPTHACPAPPAGVPPAGPPTNPSAHTPRRPHQKKRKTFVAKAWMMM